MRIGTIGLEGYILNTVFSLKEMAPFQGAEITHFQIDESINTIVDKDSVYEQNILLINSELSLPGSKRIDLKGLDLIYWLRFRKNSQKYFQGLIITFGFLNFEHLFRLNELGIILLAKGHHYIRVPISANELSSEIIKYFKPDYNTNRLEHFVPYLKYVVNLSEIRHQEANWWGIKNLWDSYYSTKSKSDKKTILSSYPIKIKNSLDVLNNHLTIIKYSNDKSIFKESNINSNKILLNSSQNLLNDIQSKQPKVLLIDDLSDDGWSEIYQHILYGDFPNKNFLSIDVNSHGTVCRLKNTIFKLIESFSPEFIILDLRLFPNKDKEKFDNIRMISGYYILRVIKEKHPGIPILISSASNKIWSFKEVLGAGADAYWIKEGIDNHMAFDRSYKNFHDLLEIISVFLNYEYKLLTSMVVKRDNLLSKNEFWWVSFHIDSKTNQDIIQSTIDFETKKVENEIESMDVSIKKQSEYNKLNKRIAKFKEKVPRLLPNLIYNDVKSVKDALSEVIYMYRNFLKRKYFEKAISDTSDIREWFYYSSLVLHLFKIVEMIHNLSTEHFDNFGNHRKIIKARNDKMGLKLLNLRNTCAHYKESKNVNLNDFELYFDNIIKYLKDGNSEKQN